MVQDVPVHPMAEAAAVPEVQKAAVLEEAAVLAAVP
jgi:hypothetical protein